MADFPYSTAAWARLRKLKLAETPLCEHCRPRLVPAVHVDHIHAISDGGPAFPTLDGLRSLCASCHSKVTARWRHGDGVDPDTGRRNDGRWSR